MKKIIAVLALMLLPQLHSFCQESGSHAASSDGAPALEFLRFVKDPVSAGMGGAGLASTSFTAMSSFANVAAVPFSRRTFDVSAGYLQWNPSSTGYLNIGVASKVKDNFGLAFGTSAGLDKKVDMQMNLGLSYRFVEWVSVGVNARFAMQKLTPDYILRSFLTDIFAMAEYNDLSVVVGVQNVGSKASYGKKSDIDAKYAVPSEATLGVRWSPVFVQVHALEIDADMRCGFFGSGFGASAGAAYTYNDLLSLRCGGCYAGKTMLSHGSLGLGVKFYGVHLDAAYLIAAKSSPLANSFTLGLGYCF